MRPGAPASEQAAAGGRPEAARRGRRQRLTRYQAAPIPAPKLPAASLRPSRSSGSPRQNQRPGATPPEAAPTSPKPSARDQAPLPTREAATASREPPPDGPPRQPDTQVEASTSPGEPPGHPAQAAPPPSPPAEAGVTEPPGRGSINRERAVRRDRPRDGRCRARGAAQQPGWRSPGAAAAGRPSARGPRDCCFGPAQASGA